MPLPAWLLGVTTGLGALGTFFGGDDEAEELLRERAEGIDPGILAAIRRRARSAIGNQATAERVGTSQELGRMDAPVAKIQEVEDKIRTRQFGAIGDTLSNVDVQNEQLKMDAIGQLAGYLGQRDANQGQGFAQLFGAGFQGLLQSDMFGGGYGQDKYSAGSAKKTFPGVRTGLGIYG